MLEWKYYKEEICKRNAKPVAILKNDDVPVLYVYEAGGHHYTQLAESFSFFKMFFIDYTYEAKLLKKRYSGDFLVKLDRYEFLLFLLKEGCIKAEKDFVKQARCFQKVLNSIKLDN